MTPSTERATYDADAQALAGMLAERGFCEIQTFVAAPGELYLANGAVSVRKTDKGWQVVVYDADVPTDVMADVLVEILRGVL